MCGLMWVRDWGCVRGSRSWSGVGWTEGVDLRYGYYGLGRGCMCGEVVRSREVVLVQEMGVSRC